MSQGQITESSPLESITGTGRTLLAIYGRFPLTGKIGVWGMGLVIAFAIFGPMLSPYDPNEQMYSIINDPPVLAHPLGTDHIGRDVLSRLMNGARLSLMIAGLSVVWAAAFGSFAGAIAGYYGGLVDDVIMRFADAVMAFPSIILAVVLAAALDPSIVNLAFVIGFPYSARYARLSRGEVLSEKEQPYVEAAEGLGMSNIGILFKEILPNTFQPVLVQITFHFPLAILAEAGLSFLGLGIPAPTATLGGMIRDGQQYLPDYWWTVIFPGIFIFLTVMAFNMFSDALQDEWDPYTDDYSE